MNLARLDKVIVELQYEEKIKNEIKEALTKDIIKRVNSIKRLIAQITEGSIGWSRNWTKVLKIYKKQDPNNAIAQYLLKPSHSISEVNNSILASKFELGPEVIYTKECNNLKKSIIIEECFPKKWDLRIRQLSKNDLIRLSIVIAKKILIMINNNFGHYENFNEHTFIIGNNIGLDIRFVDWARVTRFYIDGRLAPIFVNPKIKFAYRLLGKNQEALALFKETLISLSEEGQKKEFIQIITSLDKL